MPLVRRNFLIATPGTPFIKNESAGRRLPGNVQRFYENFRQFIVFASSSSLPV
jgi:hypothetical protein